MPIKGDKAPAKKVRMLLLLDVHAPEDPVTRGGSLSLWGRITLEGSEKH